MGILWSNKSIINKLKNGEWIYDDSGRMRYKLDKKGALIFDCKDPSVTEEEQIEFTIEALITMGIDETKAVALAAHRGKIQ